VRATKPVCIALCCAGREDVTRLLPHKRALGRIYGPDRKRIGPLWSIDSGMLLKIGGRIVCEGRVGRVIGLHFHLGIDALPTRAHVHTLVMMLGRVCFFVVYNRHRFNSVQGAPVVCLPVLALWIDHLLIFTPCLQCRKTRRFSHQSALV
jgi:hypothetical protein